MVAITFAGRPLLLLLLASAAPTAHGQTYDLRRDFEAVGDGRTGDQLAFARAATFFNEWAKQPAAARPATLRIPAGAYRVGTAGAAGMTPLLLRGCRYLTIAGADSGRTVIRYAGGLRCGAFDPAAWPRWAVPGDSRRVRLRRLAVHYFGRDGVQVLIYLACRLADPAREGIVLENSRFDL